MNIKTSILSSALFGLLLTACNEQTDIQNQEQLPDMVPVTFCRMVPDIELQTRAAGNQFETDDPLGIFAVDSINSGSSRLMATGNYAENVRYEFDGSGFVCQGNPIMQFRDTPLLLTYYVVYPYRADITPTFRFETAANQSAHSSYTRSDLAMQKITTTDLQVELQLQHLMSNVDVAVCGTDINTHSVQVAVTNVALATWVNLNSQQAVATNDVTSQVQCELYEQTVNESKFHAIVAPQTLTQGNQAVVITLDGVSTVFDLPASYQLRSNTQLSLVFDVIEDDGDIVIRYGGVEEEPQPVHARCQ